MVSITGFYFHSNTKGQSTVRVSTLNFYRNIFIEPRIRGFEGASLKVCPGNGQREARMGIRSVLRSSTDISLLPYKEVRNKAFVGR